MSKIIAVLLWIAGIILANGFWSTLLAVILPLWAWVVVVWTVLEKMQWV